MEQAGAQTIATFTGTLLRREHALGQKFVQLVFREDDKNWLCLSSNVSHTAKLQIGKAYKIEGIFKQLGERAYIHEPQIAPLARQIVKRRVWISLAAGLVILLTAGGIVFAAAHHDTPTPPATHTVQQTSVSDSSNTVDATTPDPNTTPSADTPAATPPTPPAPKPATKPASTPAPGAGTSVPQPHCDNIVTTTPEPVTNNDSTQLIGYSQVMQTSIDRQTKTCYPDTGTNSPTVNVIVAGQPQITTVGTMTPPPPPDPDPSQDPPA